MATQAHQINAVLNGYAPQAQRTLTDLHHKVQKTPLLSGIQRVFHQDNEDDKGLPSESTRVQIVAQDVAAEAADTLTRMFDLQFVQDDTNCRAKADIVLPDGTVLVPGAPVTYLMWLSKRLIDWRTFLDKLPVLDAADSWEWNEGHRAYATEPVETIVTRKETKALLLYPATDKHPAQVQPQQVDERRGVWRTVKLSGAMRAEDVKKLRARVDALTEAVRVARENANSAEASQRGDTGQKVFGYLFG